MRSLSRRLFLIFAHAPEGALRLMHWRIGVLLCALLAACSGARPRIENARPAPAPAAVEGLAAGSTLVVQRPTPGVARVSLWFDAGSRDGAPPQLATATAYWAEQHTGTTARVLPDGTELSLLCDTRTRGVGPCVEQLARAFVLPAPSATEAERLRARVRQARTKVYGAREGDAERLSFSVLFGEAAPGFMPLGVEADDARVDSAAIQRFAGELYRPARALLIAAGDVQDADVARAFASAASKARGAARARASGSLALHSGVRVMAGDQSWLSFALAAPTTEAAAAIGFRIQRLYPQASARITSVRGARLLHLRMPAGDRPMKRLQRAVFDLRRLALESEPEGTPRAEESLENLTRLLGEDWAARGAVATLGSPWPLAIGITIRMKSDTQPASDHEKKLQELHREAAAAIAAGEQNSRGETRGVIEALSASVSVGNGAHIDVRRRTGDAWMSAVVRFAGGSELDSLTRHGRSALLATLMSDSCRFTGAGSLDKLLADLGATLRPLVSPSHVGVLVSAPSRHWAGALDAVIRCALGPSLTTRGLEDARVKLLRTLWIRPELRLQSALGHLLTPSAPGEVAPWGSPQAIAGVHINEVRRLHAELLAGTRMSVLVVADADTAEVTRFVARRISQLAPGTPIARSAAPPGPESMRGELTEDGPLRAVIGLRVTERGADDLVPRVFAVALGDALSRRGLEILAGWGEARPELALGGVAVALREEALSTFNRTVQEALTELQRLPDATIAQLLTRAQLERSARWSSAAGYGRAFFDSELDAEPKPQQWLALFRKLAQSAPAFFVLRPAP